MFDLPNSPAPGDTCGVGNAVYLWDDGKWRFARYAPPYGLIARGLVIDTSGLLFDPLSTQNVMTSQNPDVMAKPGDPVAFVRTLAQPAVVPSVTGPAGFVSGSAAFQPTLREDRMLSFDGIDDGFKPSAAFNIAWAAKEFYLCALVEPDQPAVASALLTFGSTAARQNNIRIKADGTLWFDTDQIGDVSSVATKVVWGKRQVIEISYAPGTDQTFCFAVDEGPVEVLPSGFPLTTFRGAASAVNVSGIGIGGLAAGVTRYKGAIGRLITLTTIPRDPVLRSNIIEWVKGAT